MRRGSLCREAPAGMQAMAPATPVSIVGSSRRLRQHRPGLPAHGQCFYFCANLGSVFPGARRGADQSWARQTGVGGGAAGGLCPARLQRGSNPPAWEIEGLCPGPCWHLLGESKASHVCAPGVHGVGPMGAAGQTLGQMGAWGKEVRASPGSLLCPGHLGTWLSPFPCQSIPQVRG